MVSLMLQEDARCRVCHASAGISTFLQSLERYRWGFKQHLSVGLGSQDDL